MKTWKTINGLTVTRVLSGRCNCFCVGNGTNFILVDTGQAGAWPKLRKNLEALGVRKENLAALVLTHGHFDHAENAARVKREFGTVLIAHANDAGCIAKGDCPLCGGTVLPTRILMNLAGERIRRRFRYEPVVPDIEVGESHDLGPLGFRAYVIHTPGHSAGSMCVIVDGEIALTGDAMFGIFPGSIFPPFADDVPRMVRSWKTLLAAGCRLYLPAHGTANRRELVARQYEKYARRYLSREE